MCLYCNDEGWSLIITGVFFLSQNASNTGNNTRASGANLFGDLDVSKAPVLTTPMDDLEDKPWRRPGTLFVCSLSFLLMIGVQVWLCRTILITDSRKRRGAPTALDRCSCASRTKCAAKSRCGRRRVARSRLPARTAAHTTRVRRRLAAPCRPCAAPTVARIAIARAANVLARSAACRLLASGSATAPTTVPTTAAAAARAHLLIVPRNDVDNRRRVYF